MNKNTVVIINPNSVEIMKAIYNALVSNLLNVIILGNKELIQELCNKINLNINLLKIYNCNDLNDIYNKFRKIKDKYIFQGIIIDNYEEEQLLNFYNYYTVCTMIDFGVFKKSIFILKNGSKFSMMQNINEIKILCSQLHIDDFNIGIIYSDKDKTYYKRKILREVVGVKNIDVINESKIKKCKYNIILFDDKEKESEYISKLNDMVLPRIINIKKASNIFIFNAKNESFKNIFLQFVFISKTNELITELNTKAI